MKTAQQGHISPFFQVTLFGIVIILFIALLYQPIKRFHTYDKMPEITHYSPKNTQLTPIKSGLHILNFLKADVLTNDFSFEALIWFLFDPKKIPVETIEQFALERGEITKKTVTLTQKEDGLLLVQYCIAGQFKTHLDYRSYPLDDHCISLIISNPLLAEKNMYFEMQADNFTYAPDVSIPNYTIGKKKSDTGYTTSHIILGSHTKTLHTPRIVCSLECNRLDIRHFSNIFLPLLIIFFLTLFAFSFDVSEHSATIPSLASAGVPALLAYRFVIEAISPNVGYFMLSDYLFFLFLILVFMIFYFVASAMHASQYKKKIIIVNLYAVMIIGCIILFYSML